MAKFSNYLENALVNHVLRNTALSSPTTVYLALFTDDPTDADSGTEVSGGSYARQAVAFDAPSDGATANTSDIEFPEATASWGTVSHIGIYDALTDGNLLFHTNATVSKAIASGDQLIIKAGELDVTLA